MLCYTEAEALIVGGYLLVGDVPVGEAGAAGGSGSTLLGGVPSFQQSLVADYDKPGRVMTRMFRRHRFLLLIACWLWVVVAAGRGYRR